MSASATESQATHETIDQDVHTIVAVWTCNNPELPSQEEHVMDENVVPSLDVLSDKYVIHHHDTCLSCEDYNRSYEGDLDRVEIRDKSGEVIRVIEPQTLIEEYGMDEF